MTAATKAIEQYGIVVPGTGGSVKANPACAVERDARAQFLGALKQLNLDLEPLHDGPGRPAGS